MAQRVFVKVIGFTDVERHALNTVFRLSEDRDTSYALWMPDAPQPPQLALLDGQTYESGVEAELAAHPALKFIWVGDAPPGHAWRAFERPIAWNEVLAVMDELFTPGELDADEPFDDEREGPVTVPDVPGPPPKRALIASASLDDRMYMRAKLALARLTLADEAESATQAVAMARQNGYAVALVDFDMPGVDGWSLLKQLAREGPVIPCVIGVKQGVTLMEKLKARLMCGARGLFDKPPHPGKLHSLLERV